MAATAQSPSAVIGVSGALVAVDPSRFVTPLHEDQEHTDGIFGRHCDPIASAASGLDAGVRSVHRSIEVHGRDLKPGSAEHRLEEPAKGAVLGADVLGEVLARVPPRGISGGLAEPNA